MEFLNNLFCSKEKQNLVTNLSSSRCIERLREKTEKENILSDIFIPLFRKDAIVSSFKQNEFKLRKRVTGRRYSEAFYYGKLSAKGKGTMIDGYFSISYFQLGDAYNQKDYILRFMIKTLEANALEDSE